MYLMHDTYFECDFLELIGKTIIKLIVEQGEDNYVTFICSDGTIYDMWHDQDCCETVTIEEIIGNLDFLLRSPVTMAEVASNNNHDKETWKKDEKSTTWTFYKLATVRGYVTIRWLGESNGYYSEEVKFSRRK